MAQNEKKNANDIRRKPKRTAKERAAAERRAKRKAQRRLMRRIKTLIKIELCLVLLVLIGWAGLTALDLKDCFHDVKASAKETVVCLIKSDVNGAADAAEQLKEGLDDAEALVSSPLAQMAKIVPGLGKDVRAAEQLIPATQEMSRTIIDPSIEQLRQTQISIPADAGSGKKLAVAVVHADGYLSIVRAQMPQVESYVSQLSSLPKMHIGALENKIRPIRELGQFGELLLPTAQNDIFPLWDSMMEDMFGAIGINAENTELTFSAIKDADAESLRRFEENAETFLPQTLQAMLQACRDLAADESNADNLAAELEGLLTLMNDKCSTLILPGVRLLAEHPLSALMPGGGQIDVREFSAYLNFLESAMPEIRGFNTSMRTLNIDNESLTASRDKLCGKLDGAIALYDRAEKYIPFAKGFLGSGESKTYLIAAQNSAEIRASGGFPGAMGFLKVRDGIMKLEDFDSVYNVLGGATNYSYRWEPFLSGRLNADHDACYSPYFPWVAEVWELDARDVGGYRRVDGVVSLTPAIIQDLLGVTGPVTLADGTVLTGENATYELQFNVYHKYQSGDSEVWNGELVDKLFAESANLVFKKIFSSINLNTISGLLDVFEKRIDDRIIMIWMNDEELERIVTDMGADGGFNTDPTKAEFGVYLSNSHPSKLGWFLDLDVDVGDGVANADGSYSYPVKVKVTNSLDPAFVRHGGFYIVGDHGGTANTQLVVAAPAEGEITNVRCDDANFDFMTYRGNEICYLGYTLVDPGESWSCTFTVKTSTKSDGTLGLSTTPTLTAYREAANSIDDSGAWIPRQ